ncbi:MAG: hypothetical protein WCV62_04765 [Candidatus Peribacteraceae bacterium]|jgi:hypothetical protein
MKRFLSPWLFLLSSLPVAVRAQEAEERVLHVPGLDLSILQVMGNFVGLAALWIVPLTVTLFLIGAFMTVAGAGKEEWSKKGKQVMVGSLIGMAVVLLAAVIIKFIFYVIF